MFKKMKFINILLIISVILLFTVFILAAISQIIELRNGSRNESNEVVPMEEYVPVDPNLSSPPEEITPESLIESLKSLEL